MPNRKQAREYLDQIKEATNVFELNKIHNEITFGNLDNLYYDLLTEIITNKSELIIVTGIDKQK